MILDAPFFYFGVGQRLKEPQFDDFSFLFKVFYLSLRNICAKI